MRPAPVRSGLRAARQALAAVAVGGLTACATAHDGPTTDQLAAAGDGTLPVDTRTVADTFAERYRLIWDDVLDDRAVRCIADQLLVELTPEELVQLSDMSDLPAERVLTVSEIVRGCASGPVTFTP